MSEKKKRSNPFLVLLVLFLCLLSGFFLQRSSSDMNLLSARKEEASVSAEEQELSNKTGEVSLTETPAPTITPTSTPVPSPSPTPTSAEYFVSPEAEKGEWVPVEDNWSFVVDGEPLTGWFYDADGHVYYFNTKGIMQIGWLNQGGKRFYFDEDGILQKGKHLINDKVYLFAKDGSLEGYAEPTPTPAPEPTQPPQIPQRALPLPNGNMPAVALTFDDGPGDYTNDLLNCLAEHDAKATFFMVGERVPIYSDVVARMAKLGCELGNHTYHHKDLLTITKEEIQNELASTNAELKSCTGQEATVVRPPNGSYNDSVSAVIPYPIILWSIDTLDWSTRDVESTVSAVMEHVQDGSVILMHDIYQETVEAAKILIEKLSEAGYQLLTVSELAALHEIPLNPGTGYSQFTY